MLVEEIIAAFAETTRLIAIGTANDIGIYNFESNDANTVDASSAVDFDATAATNGVKDFGQDIAATVNEQDMSLLRSVFTRELSASAAYLAFGWFMVTTRAHENHAYFALPLLAMALPTSRFYWTIFWLLSLTLFLNMAYHDFGLDSWRLARFTAEEWRTLQLINAGLNVVVFLVWSAYLWMRQPPRGKAAAGAAHSPALARRP